MACQLPLRHKSPECNGFSVEAFPRQIAIEEYSRTYGEYSAGIRRTDPAHEPRILRQGPRSVRFPSREVQGLILENHLKRGGDGTKKRTAPFPFHQTYIDV
jgi:hypothetical protein